MDALPSEGLPPGWTRAKVGEVGLVQLGRQRSPQYHQGPNMRPYLRVANVFEDRIDISDVMEMDFDAADFAAYRLEPGDILLNEGQSSQLVGRPAMFRGELADCCFTNSLVRFRCGPAIEPDYALLLFRHWLHNGTFQRIAKITTNIAHLGAGRFADLEMPVAPAAEQARIVTAVNALFEEVEAGEASLARAREGLTQFRASLLHAACTGALSGDGGDGWQTKPLAELISEGPKNGYSPKAGDNENGTLALKLTATTSGRLNLAPHAIKRLSETIPRASPLYLRSGDLLFQRGNTPEYVGIAAIYDGPAETFVYPDLMIRVRTTDPALTEWIWRVANAPLGRKHMRNAASGTAGSMPKITSDAIRSLPVPLPPRDEMVRLLHHIAREMDATDFAEAALDHQRVSVWQLRQSILHAAFTGRLVAQDTADEPAAALLARLRAAPAAARRARGRRAATQPDLIETPA